MCPLSNVCHILYLTDLSAAASPAWQHALMLAQLLHAQVHVVYWTDHVGYTWTVPPANGGPDTDLLTKSAANVHTGTMARPDLQQVTAEDAVAVASGGGGIDLVVLGLTSKQSIQEDTLPELLLRNLECPLWVVGPRCQEAERQTLRDGRRVLPGRKEIAGGEAAKFGTAARHRQAMLGTFPPSHRRRGQRPTGARGEAPSKSGTAAAIHLPGMPHVAPPRRILYASPLRHDGRAPDLARYFSGIAQGNLKMIHVLPWSPAEVAEDVLRSDGAFERAGKALAALVDDGSSAPFQLTVRSAASRAEVILEESSSSDLVVLPVHTISASTLVGRGTIAQLIEQLQCPVLIVPEKWAVA